MGNVSPELVEAGETGKLVSRAAGEELRSIRADYGGYFRKAEMDSDNERKDGQV